MADFRGTQVGISNIQIAERSVVFNALFKDSKGVVHGHVKHSLPLERKELRTAVTELVKVLTEIAKDAHYTGTHEEHAHGIAEVLRNASDQVERAEEDSL